VNWLQKLFCLVSDGKILVNNLLDYEQQPFYLEFWFPPSFFSSVILKRVHHALDE